MSDFTSTRFFEYPLNERMRTWLRIEFLLQQLTGQKNLNNIASALIFFRTASDLIDVLERSEARTELLKELERQQKKLAQWVGAPNVDTTLINSLRDQLKDCAEVLMSTLRIGKSLKEDRLVNMVRQRLGIPCGCCSFDLPMLHLWLHLPLEQQSQYIDNLINSLIPLSQAVTMILDLIRQSGVLHAEESQNGFFQGNAYNADLLRLRIPLQYQLYPQVSGYKTRYSIRFLPLDSEKGIIPEYFGFELACC
ncbi:cell division protein ZapD [Candidatus Fukatsuia symbiotica]|uniref:Cell division protein ZapD n=1 Tax=Candidatus Fukatsuia symbiotica TaxID=1878942 RepID=A0A2U8I2S2_9GAMM|nr:cell division protein ZapD [Candidatus Fukatsuia symbiotica]AWK13412.1 cell division protein ZapD [Candidatus Fukatsuia symbiotica]MEA9444304.1 cell division protein ZapD [Candidatus Fukatsuia symbiotica]